MELVDTINAMYELCPQDEVEKFHDGCSGKINCCTKDVETKELFAMCGERVLDILDEFNALNLVGIIRIFNKMEVYTQCEVTCRVFDR